MALLIYYQLFCRIHNPLTCQIHWIYPINERFKLNFDGLRIENKNTLEWVIKNSNGTTKMVVGRYIYYIIFQ